MSVAISIKHAVKKYGDSTIIPDLSLDIHEGEFFTLLGPSGCGKTTLLRMIAGFNSIEGGDFYFNDKRINDLDPAKRNIGMVFQNYAIFPHYTVRQNVEFGLKNKGVPAKERREKSDEFLRLMEELGKINRIIDREFAEGYRETLVVLDATTGQNAMSQAKMFKECSQVTGVVLSKMDSTAKGGMAISIQAELGLPVKYVGEGEKIEDLKRFDAKKYVEDIFAF